MASCEPAFGTSYILTPPPVRLSPFLSVYHLFRHENASKAPGSMNGALHRPQPAVPYRAGHEVQRSHRARGVDIYTLLLHKQVFVILQNNGGGRMQHAASRLN